MLNAVIAYRVAVSVVLVLCVPARQELEDSYHTHVSSEPIYFGIGFVTRNQMVKSERMHMFQQGGSCL